MQHKSRWAVAGIVALVCAVAGVLIANFVGGETRIERRIERLYPLDDPRFVQELGVLLGPPFLPGNRAQALLNGDEIFPPMLAAIRAAQVSITFETYIYWSGDIGKAFAEALAERARAGVEVNVVIDWVGGMKMDAGVAARSEWIATPQRCPSERAARCSASTASASRAKRDTRELPHLMLMSMLGRVSNSLTPAPSPKGEGKRPPPAPLPMERRVSLSP